MSRAATDNFITLKAYFDFRDPEQRDPCEQLPRVDLVVVTTERVEPLADTGEQAYK